MKIIFHVVCETVWIMENPRELQRARCEVFREDTRPKLGSYKRGDLVHCLRATQIFVWLQNRALFGPFWPRNGFLLPPLRGQNLIPPGRGILYHIVYEQGGCWVGECMGAIEHDGRHLLPAKDRNFLPETFTHCSIFLFSRPIWRDETLMECHFFLLAGYWWTFLLGEKMGSYHQIFEESL